MKCSTKEEMMWVQRSRVSGFSGGSWMRIKGRLNKEDLELMLKINGDFTLSNSD
jgi:hypothetical protein